MLRVVISLALPTLFLASCQKGGDSVVTVPASSTPAAVAPSPAVPAATSAPTATDAASPAPQAAPATTAGARPADPFAIGAAGAQRKSGDPSSGKNITGMPGVTTRPYKPTPTPGDPFPPRPTPTVVLKDGKPVQEWQAPPEALSLTNPYKGNAEAIKIGQAYYNQRCSDCHGGRGYGNGGMSRGLKKPPTNLASRMVQANTDGELFWKITNGRSPMPANRVRFDDNQRWYIVTFLRSLK
jgi:mono/diheme cytochrome c family protein